MNNLKNDLKLDSRLNALNPLISRIESKKRWLLRHLKSQNLNSSTVINVFRHSVGPDSDSVDNTLEDIHSIIVGSDLAMDNNGAIQALVNYLEVSN